MIDRIKNISYDDRLLVSHKISILLFILLILAISISMVPIYSDNTSTPNNYGDEKSEEMTEYVNVNSTEQQPQNPFIMVVNTSLDNQNPDADDSSFTVSTNNDTSINYEYNYTIETNGTVLNDEEDLRNVNSYKKIRYSEPGVYKVKISGDFPHMSNKIDTRNYSFGAGRIISVEQWGDIKWKNMSYMFSGSYHLSSVPSDEGPDMSTVRNTSYMFYKADSLNQDLDHLNMSNVRDMRYMFRGAGDFNGNIGSWDTSNVRNMSGMFYTAYDFNREISNWKTGNVKDMRYMFYLATEFNRDISSWDTSNVNNMRHMFSSADSFNKDIGSWDTSNVTRMDFMFASADSFDKDIGDWNVSNVDDMSYMLHQASSFDQNLNDWNVTKDTETENMLGGWEYTNGGKDLVWKDQMDYPAFVKHNIPKVEDYEPPE